MNIPQTYDYLIRARRDLWRTLESVPDEILSRPLIPGDRFHSIKDLVFHIADVEDGWLHGDILRTPPVQMSFPSLAKTNGPIFDAFPLALLLDYWRAVEQSTLAYLATLNKAELNRIVTEQGSITRAAFHRGRPPLARPHPRNAPHRADRHPAPHSAHQAPIARPALLPPASLDLALTPHSSPEHLPSLVSPEALPAAP
jgi:hypothetical protein